MNIDRDTLLLWSKFNYRFHEEGHYYVYEDKRVKTSVTQFIAKFHKEFDENKWSKHTAKKEGITQQEVLARWKLAANNSATTGTLFHNRAEQLALGKHLEKSSEHYSDDIVNRLNLLIPLQDKFFNDVRGKLTPLKTEFTVGVENLIAGNIDLLVWNDKEQEIQIWDYKTNKEITFNNIYEKMYYPFNRLDSCNYNHYSIQLNIYKYIIERQLGIKIGKCYIVHFNENNEDYKIHKCLDLSNEVSIAIEEYIKETV